MQVGPRSVCGSPDRPGASSFPAQMLPGPPASRPWQQRCPWTAGPEHPASQEPSIHPHIPNPMVCLEEGDVILFQLHILRHNRSASHYPVYQKQHLFNSNPRWDFGAFRRLGHLVRETGLTFSRFAHQFLDPGTYVFRDNGQPESMAVVLVKARGAACEPGQAPVQPSSPDQLARHGVLRHRLPDLGPDWAAISGVLLAVGMTTVLLTGLGLLLRPSSQAQACPARAWRPQWRGLGEPHMPTGDVALGDSSLLSENPGPWGSEEGASCTGKAAALGTGKALLAKTLEDFSVRTLYDKLEDQSLHMAAQLSKHRSDTLAFYRGASQQLQGLQDLLQGLSTTKQPGLGRVGDPETGARATARTHAGQSEASQGSLTAASPREPWQRPPGGTFRAPAPGRQPELEQALAGLAAALSQTQELPAGASSAGAPHQGQNQGALLCPEISPCAFKFLTSSQTFVRDNGHSLV
ncbi:uncharacterized protein LOC125113608 [Phacochoerus africanus]|uniref:uncharacterized protein LOC125113608 n=1 Tax=Phacochoerus africanus TaxID=41426 RepID=UPI001FDA3579|nr:uncharacterized protein LOC125113608 [Phacochoerus africanus]